MFKKITTSLMATAAIVLATSGCAAPSGDEITVGYFLEWPMPMLAAKANGTYDEALGMKVNWVSFETGTAMNAAMASGDVQISVSQGVAPFVIGTSGGQGLQIVDVAVSYSEHDNCVVSSGLEIDASNAAELSGKKVAVPLGTAGHYGFLRQMDHFGVSVDSLQVIDMAPPEGAVALGQGAVDFACGFGGGLTRMKEYGNVLLTGDEKEDLGILVFDITSAPSSYIAERGDVVAKFLAVTAKANLDWQADPSDEKLTVLASEAGIDLEAARASINGMKFPTIEEQLSEKWLGGTAATFMKGVADVFVEAGSIDSALDSYQSTVNIGPLTAAGKM